MYSIDKVRRDVARAIAVEPKLTTDEGSRNTVNKQRTFDTIITNTWDSLQKIREEHTATQRLKLEHVSNVRSLTTNNGTYVPENRNLNEKRLAIPSSN